MIALALEERSDLGTLSPQTPSDVLLALDRVGEARAGAGATAGRFGWRLACALQVGGCKRSRGVELDDAGLRGLKSLGVAS